MFGVVLIGEKAYREEFPALDLEVRVKIDSRDEALRLVDEESFRAWRIWLAASSLSFEDGYSSIYQVLLAKRGAARVQWTREYMYRPAC